MGSVGAVPSGLARRGSPARTVWSAILGPMDPSGASGPKRDRRVGIRDVASRAGVGLATASRVLSGRPNVNADMRRRVLAAAEELGYQPDMLAQSLRRGATRSVGFIADDLSNHLIADIATGAERRLRAEGYSLLVMNSEMDAEPGRGERARAARASGRRADDVRRWRRTTPTSCASWPRSTSRSWMSRATCLAEVPASYVHSDHRAGVAMALRDLIDARPSDDRAHRRTVGLPLRQAAPARRRRRPPRSGRRRSARRRSRPTSPRRRHRGGAAAAGGGRTGRARSSSADGSC